MKLSELGEFGFIEHFSGKFNTLVNKDEMGIGDDCAVISFNEQESYVVSTDLLIEDVHFLKDRILPEELGHKSLAINLSDIAAMGAEPLHSFLSIGIPKDIELEYLDRFMDGYHRLSQKYNTPLMGGDTTGSADKLVINVAVIGKGRKNELHFRSMASERDLICVTGNLGDSGAGLMILLNDLELTADNKELLRRHYLPEPRLKEGKWLARQDGVGAMIDISDGIASDLQHVLKASGKSANVYLEKIPVSELLLRTSGSHGWNIHDLSTGAGEDYELLFTLRPGDFDEVNAAYRLTFGKSLNVIGEITGGKERIKWFERGRAVVPGKGGFDHFKNKD